MIKHDTKLILFENYDKIKYISKEEMRMVDSKIKELRMVFNKWKGELGEEHVRFHIILNTFLPIMNYETDNCRLEEKIGKGFCDILVPIKGKKTLLIEVKNGEHVLTNTDIEQVKRYATSRGQEYAILTNGKEYILLNFNISSQPVASGDVLKSNIVFWFDIFKDKGKELTDLQYFNYLSYENLYDMETTNFFADIAQYKIWKFEDGLSELSWVAYQSTLYNYYDFIAEKYKKYQGIYGRMSEDDFEEFIYTRKRNGTKSSIKTVANNHTHIFDMLSLMKKRGKISHFNFEENRTKSLESFLETENKKIPVRLKGNDISKAVEMYSSKKNSARNIVVYLLCVTLGMERSEILNMKWENFDSDFKHINLYGRKIELNNMLKRYLQLFQKEQGRKKGYLFVALYNGKYKKVTESTINDVFNEFKKVEEYGDVYSPKFLKNCLILSMFYDGYSIEDIIYVTNIDMKNLAKYITTEMIVERRKGTMNWSKLYDGILCE